MKFEEFQSYFRFHAFPSGKEEQEEYWEMWSDIKTIRGRVLSKDQRDNDSMRVYNGFSLFTILGRKNEFRNVQCMDEVFLYGLPATPRDHTLLRNLTSVLKRTDSSEAIADSDSENDTDTSAEFMSDTASSGKPSTSSSSSSSSSSSLASSDDEKHEGFQQRTLSDSDEDFSYVSKVPESPKTSEKQEKKSPPSSSGPSSKIPRLTLRRNINGHYSKVEK
ncbi:Oidioi.mRNA.OKI2018_I69.chr1.g3457.t1.cds [Oikopleura dioica]|uniref:Oidioi.mRNA.OKI2018_I69.chr1.g3457.t1.cds n=1 Tax=Oikopleura dioica TaxID=34765 RepID=A0ABN7SU48_OIKDI|nr:Oidioi.mRNA.OKI2018_I69.chr1.g3457.t1.cds [Oikopleura dioica]